MSLVPRSHRLSRRSFMRMTGTAGAATLAAKMSDIEVLTDPARIEQLMKSNKRVILVWLAGGASQLETWDPKPGRLTGGPFAKIQTCFPGIEISELLPKM